MNRCITRTKMNKKISNLLVFALCSGALLISPGCEDKDNFTGGGLEGNENPLAEVNVPKGFEWKTITPVDVSITVAGNYTGSYKYTVEVFDKNPIISADAKLIYKGFAQNGKTVNTQIAIPAALTEVYVRQTAPTKLSTVRVVSIENNTIACNLGSSAKAAQRITRADDDVVTVPEIDWTDTTLFPQAAPSDNQIVIVGEGNWKNDATKNYIVNKQTTAINNYGTAGVKFYVTEDVTISTLGNNLNAKCYILPGVKLTLDVAEAALSSWTISIGTGAELEITGAFKPSDGKIYNNQGTLTATKLHTVFTAEVYNAGTINLSGEGQKNGLFVDSNSKLFNFGTINAKDYSTSAYGVTYNDSGAEVTIDGASEFNGSKTVWVNNGAWTTENANAYSFNNVYINKCKMIVNDTFHITEGSFTNDTDSYISTTDFYMHKGKFSMNSGSFLDISGVATLSENTKTNREGFFGVGTGKALIRMAEATTTENKFDRMINYEGNLQIACSQHPSDTYAWTCAEEVEWAGYGNPTVEISETGCNPGIAGGGDDPEPPTENEPIVDPYTYSFMFEDQWPKYGDYDMNDIVIYVENITKTPNSNGLIEKLSFDYTLKAVGAKKQLAAAVMFGQIAPTDITSVSYSEMTPSNFNTAGNGTEEGQDYAVIPLFDNAHQYMEKTTEVMVNTVRGSSENVENPATISMEITFAKPVEATALTISEFNLFVITTLSVPGNLNVKSDDRIEIHIIGYEPSKKANTAIFGTANDASTDALPFVSQEGLTWGIVIPDEFKWPSEWRNVLDAYGEFKDWIISGGTESKEWWKRPTDTGAIF